jgi:adenylylsulfate kinase-like enzyme
VDDPYEVPESPDLVVDAEATVVEAVDLVLGVLERAVDPPAPTSESSEAPN